MPVSVAAVLERRITEWEEFSGRLEAVERVDVRPRVSGYIEAVHFAPSAVRGRPSAPGPHRVRRQPARPAVGHDARAALFDNRDGRMAPGLFARIKVGGAGERRAVLIDDRAVGTDQSKKFVLVVGADKRLAYREVTLEPVVDGCAWCAPAWWPSR